MQIVAYTDYAAFFRAATAGDPPFAYQSRLAEGAEPEGNCVNLLIDVPTGCGKTAAVVLSWIWNRVHLKRPGWPRRLVYCLPMRTLVEQTCNAIQGWLAQIGLTETVALHVLMGGEAASDWDLYPECDAILIGTQDMLLSRALNRGYGQSRYRWPLSLGMLNNDCLWVMDETQLMGPGLVTTAQLDAFRTALWKTEKPCLSWWMSATVSGSVFDSTDRVALSVLTPKPFSLFGTEREELIQAGRLGAEKKITLLAAPPRSGREILDKHLPGRITLLIVNTVPTAVRWRQEILGQIEAQHTRPTRGRKKASPTSPAPSPTVLLLHSRFRAPDRRTILDELTAFMTEQARHKGQVPDHPGIIVISTQVIEAGFDISAARLWSEIAPWPSVVQRLGRLNREGQQPDAQAFFWSPKDKSENEKNAPNGPKRIGPYPVEELKASSSLIRSLSDRLATDGGYGSALAATLASPESRAAMEAAPQACLRPDDLHELFSTESDLAGGFTNIAPYVRQEDRNSDVFVYWRELKANPGDAAEATDADAGRDELVAVPFYELARFLKNRRQPAFFWDEEAEQWLRVSFMDVVSGMELLLPTSAGGYSASIGWTGEAAHQPVPIHLGTSKHNSQNADPESVRPGWQTLGEHTSAVEAAVPALLERLILPSEFCSALLLAARWHDVGKAHLRWQAPLLPHAPRPASEPWGKFTGVPTFRPGLRHEAASLLAAWERWTAANNGDWTALVLYLIASHHGKVRTVLRSNSEGSDLFGLRESDLPVPLPDGSTLKISTALKSFAGQGVFDWVTNTFTPQRPSWAGVIAELLGPAWRDDPVVVDAIPAHEPRGLGPFRLAYLEAIFRAADIRASQGEFQPANPVTP